MPNMDSAVRFIFLIVFAMERALAQPACQPSYPNFIAPIPGDKNTPRGLEGLWYMFRQKIEFGGLAGSINQRIQWAGVADTVDPLTGLPALAMTTQYAQYDVPENKTCFNHFFTGLYIEDGRSEGTVAVTEDNLVLRKSTFTVVHHEYDKIFIAYSCFSLHLNGSCTIPEIIVKVRKRPDMLSAAEMKEYDDIFNKIFEKYCVKADEAPLQPYTDDLAYCPFVDWPACTIINIDGLKKLNVSGGGSTNYSSSGSSSSCRWPYSIPAKKPYDPTQAEGQWTAYRFLSIESNIAEAQFTWHNAGQTLLSFEDTIGQQVWMEYIMKSTGGGCVNSYFVGEFGTNGEAFGLLGPIASQANARYQFKATVVYFDGSFALYYGCIIPDPISGTCRVPFLLSGVRAGSTPMDKTKWDGIISSAVGKYGCSANNVPLVMGDTAVTSPCPSVPLTDLGQTVPNGCVNLNVRGLREGVVNGTRPDSTGQTYG